MSNSSKIKRNGAVFRRSVSIFSVVIFCTLLLGSLKAVSFCRPIIADFLLSDIRRRFVLYRRKQKVSCRRPSRFFKRATIKQFLRASTDYKIMFTSLDGITMIFLGDLLSSSVFTSSFSSTAFSISSLLRDFESVIFVLILLLN